MYQVEVLAQGNAGAVKLQVLFKEHAPRTDDVADVQAQGSSSYRRAYGEWPRVKPKVVACKKRGEDGTWEDHDPHEHNK